MPLNGLIRPLEASKALRALQGRPLRALQGPYGHYKGLTRLKGIIASSLPQNWEPLHSLLRAGFPLLLAFSAPQNWEPLHSLLRAGFPFLIAFSVPQNWEPLHSIHSLRALRALQGP